MAHFENITLEKGMYSVPGKSFTQVLEELDSSENYRGTSLEGLDAFQRQLKRYHIKVSGPGSDQVEQFFEMCIRDRCPPLCYSCTGMSR